jgi:iron complex outermembrane receptor protein
MDTLGLGFGLLTASGQPSRRHKAQMMEFPPWKSAALPPAAARTGRRSLALAIPVLVLGGLLAETASAAGSAAALKTLSVEELMDLEVYSASRRLESSQSTPSAIFVLTRTDIRRARVTSVPEALRLVPGVQVGRVDANKWAVSIRGFNSREANKLLVLVDGRSIYDQLFSGMLWESQDFLLRDVDRIEVIRGPGGTLWGANAVNGVINIITRHARDTQGTVVEALAGDEERFIAGLRHGWQPTDSQYARVWFQAFQRDEGHSDTVPPKDDSRGMRAGFRWDWEDGDDDRLTVSGDLFRNITGIRELEAPLPPVVQFQDVTHRGGFLQASWDHRISDTNSIQVQAWYDQKSYGSAYFDQSRHTADLDLQQTWRAAPRHLLVWGAGYRYIMDDTDVDFFGIGTASPETRRDDLLTAYVQDTITLVHDRLDLVLGAKFERTDYAASQWSPNLRLAWTPSPEDTVWLAVSRAARVPSRLEVDLEVAGFKPGATLGAEHVTAYEVGSRHLLNPGLWVDLAAFYNDYEDLLTPEITGQVRNRMGGHTYGAELAARWQALEYWRLDLSYSWLRMNLALDADSTANPSLPRTHEGLAPRHQASLRSALDLPRNFELDLTLRFVDELDTLDFDSYLTLDAGLGWSQGPRGLALAVVGRNLLDSPHPEQDFVFASAGVHTDVERSWYVKASWRF